MSNGTTELSAAYLSQIVQDLDITPTELSNAESRYQAVGEWLAKDGSDLAIYSPLIYPQGSFLLGTMIRPLGSECELDIDLVCRLEMGSEVMSQRRLKEVVGRRLRSNAMYTSMLEEMNRCWRLNYAGQFHMDILPAIPDVPSGNEAILVPDKELSNWHKSNPKAFAQWFRSRMESQLLEQRKALAAIEKADVESIPEHRVKTTLQKSIQLLKRHRDVTFQRNQTPKPISIIITTLAANAYLGEGDLEVALATILRDMDKSIEVRDAEYWIPNPINPSENFADKWKEHPERKEAFFEWLDRARSDFGAFIGDGNLSARLEALGSALAIEDDILSKLNAGTLANPNRESALFDVAHRQPLKWPLNLGSSVEIVATVTEPGFRQRRLDNNEPSLQKRAMLRFTAKTNAPPKYELHWQVVNTGAEAESANCLRGGFEHTRLLEKDESTLYKGMHWIECFVVKDRICVARSGEFVINIE